MGSNDSDPTAQRNENKEQQSQQKPPQLPQQESKELKVIAPATKDYYIKIVKHNLIRKNNQIVFRIDFASNFPKEAYIKHNSCMKVTLVKRCLVKNLAI